MFLRRVGKHPPDYMTSHPHGHRCDNLKLNMSVLRSVAQATQASRSMFRIISAQRIGKEKKGKVGGVFWGTVVTLIFEGDKNYRKHIRIVGVWGKIWNLGFLNRNHECSPLVFEVYWEVVDYQLLKKDSDTWKWLESYWINIRFYVKYMIFKPHLESVAWTLLHEACLHTLESDQLREPLAKPPALRMLSDKALWLCHAVRTVLLRPRICLLSRSSKETLPSRIKLWPWPIGRGCFLVCKYLHAKCVSCHHGMARPQVVKEGNGLQVWRLTASILNKKSQTTCKGCPSLLCVWKWI
jgi:hypothetical protein